VFQYDLETDEGAEMAEEFKIRSLIAMTEGCKNIGIPFFSLSTGKHAFY
jgi:CO dehydrogenase/acetyl-CoA synthase alpha subunit